MPACAPDSKGPAQEGNGADNNGTEHTGEAHSAIFSNGGFESGTNNQAPPSWTVTTNLNPGVTIQTPQTRAGLNLSAGGNPLTRTLVTTAGPESQTDANLGTTASFRWPKFGNAVALVNQLGQNKNVNSMKQSMTVSAADIDSIDGLAHVRFLLAPVLQDPGHTADQQPYFYVQLTNLSKGNSVLYTDYNFANQPGVPWKNNGAGITYTDWALVDIAPGSAQLAVGDQVELEVIAAGCSLGGHWGQVYVDGVGASVPGAFVSATGPAAANDNTDITYTITYKNDGTSTAGGVVVEFNTPPNTTFTSFNAPGLTCTAPAAGSAGLVTCTVGTLPAGGNGSFQITVHINNGATGTITAGNYDIQGTGISPLLGPKVYTAITHNVTYADLAITKTDGVTTVAAGQSTTYSIVVTNAGPSAVTNATVTDTLPGTLTNATWTCVGTTGASCTASGTGSINDGTVSIPVGGKVTYTLTATVPANAAAGQLANIASVSLPSGASDPTPVNDSVGDYDAITAANGTSCTTNAECTSGVCDPKNNKCGWADGDGPCTPANGPAICQSGVCSPNGTICIPAGGCAVDADCASTQWCNTETLACAPKLPNGTTVPTVAGHAPPLTGTCTSGVGAAVCVSGVCDTNDNQCGYKNGDGPCTLADAAVVCRSGACSADGTCMVAGGCNIDADCSGQNWCNISAHACTPKVDNGIAMPSDPGHTSPVVNATCNAAAAALVCVSGVCDTNDNQCGYANGDGPCTLADAAVVCRSGACSADGTCMVPGGCNIDADCSGQSWCNISVHACAPKVDNGGVMPSDPGHASPVVNATCNDAAAALVCVSGVCDADDDKCGYKNGDGTCTTANAATVCRSGACDPDGKCGFANGDGPCVPDNGAPCRSGACSAHGKVCMPIGGCAVDADCGAGEWCNTEVFACKPKLPNGTTIPTVGGHAPPLGGTCSSAVGAAVCASGVCDTADNQCGFANGDGPCNAANGPVVCRSGACGTNGVCEPPAACNADADCKTATEYCDTGAHTCAPKQPNGAPLPTVTGHTPDLDGTCNTTAAPIVCQSAVCDAADNACGYKNGDGPCTVENAGTVCRSSTCSANGNVCIPSGGCAVDADCDASDWCNTQTFTCTPKLPNGGGMPNVGGHTPVLDGKCSPDAATAVCASGVCDTNDDKCGYANGDGPCTTANGAVVCRSALCGSNGTCVPQKDCTSDDQCDQATQYCDTGAGICAPKLPNGSPLPAVPGHSPTLDGSCTDSSAQIVCQSGVCDPEDGLCGHAIGEGPCDATNGAVVCRSGQCAVTGPNQGLCVECVADAQCLGSQPVCDPNSNACVQCTTADAEACAGSTPVCVAGPETCAPCDGDLGDETPRACNKAESPYCFLSGPSAGECGKCTTNAECAGHPSGPICDTTTGACGTACHVDADCDAASWCNAPANGSGTCVPKLDNGTHLPANPSEVATCTDAVGTRVCKSGVCDTSTNECGYENGNGPCSDASVCQSGACDTKDQKCGFADGNGPCMSDAVCRSSHCDTATQLCGKPTNPGCTVDTDCKSTEFCRADGACTTKHDDGETCSGANQCQSGACVDKICDSIVASGNGLLCAAQPSSDGGSGRAATLIGLMLATAGLVRRRRR
ncbi:Hypothetical protein A7982_06319 [Minicystis rosea]|nr:Hypothetical protein A7982_06319 [Minicystis rosea]